MPRFQNNNIKFVSTITSIMLIYFKLRCQNNSYNKRLYLQEPTNACVVISAVKVKIKNTVHKTTPPAVENFRQKCNSY